MRYLIKVGYDGTEFSGWQRQPGKRTVQEELERAAAIVFGVATKVTASGRTDAGVHALGQIASLDGETAVPPEKLRECFNRLLPPDVKVGRSAAVSPDFDVTRMAKRKTYRYRAYFAEFEQPLLARYAARLKQEPDLDAMRKAGELLIGRHDFAAFRSAGYTSKTSERTLFSLGVEKKSEEGYPVYEITVTGDGFLYNMVRILAGELFAVGCGKEEGITRAFRTGERAALARTLPPQGLCLLNVDYGSPLFGDEV